MAEYHISSFTDLPTRSIVSLFNFSLSKRCVVTLIVVLICIFLMTDDVEHLFMCVSDINISSLVKCHNKSRLLLNWVFLTELYEFFI